MDWTLEDTDREADDELDLKLVAFWVAERLPSTPAVIDEVPFSKFKYSKRRTARRFIAD